MIPIHPDDPDWATALYCTPRTPGAKPRLRGKRRPIERLLDTINIIRYRWWAGGRSSKRYREVKVFEAHAGLANEGEGRGGADNGGATARRAREADRR